MSPSQNPDFWRSQGGPANPPNAPKPGNGPAAAPGTPADKTAPGAAQGNVPTSPATQPVDKPKIEASGGGDPVAPSSGIAKEKNPQVPPSNTSVPETPATGLDKPPATASLADKLGDKTTNYLNNKIDSIGSKKPDNLDDPNRNAPSTSVGRDLEMSKEAVKGALGGAAKGAVKGAITGGAHGAALGATKQGVVSAAERINKTSATQRADQNRGPSNAGSLLDKAGSSASLEKSRMDTAARFGGGTAAAGGGASGALPPGADLTPEEAVAVAKAAATVANRLVIGVSKAAGISILVVVSLVLMLITSITGAIAPVAASAAAYSASSASCEAPSSTSGGSSPGNKGDETGLKPAGIKSMRYVNSKWGGKVADIGGVRNEDGSDHMTGNAIDVMIPDYSSATGNALGTEIANDLQKNADKLGISYLIWDGKFWNNSHGTSWNYMGTGTYGPLEWAPYITSASPTDDNEMHRNHVHVSVNDEPGEPLESASVSAASYIQSQLPPATEPLSFDRASFTTMLPAVDNTTDTSGYASVGLSSAEQLTNAKTIIGMAKTVGFNREGALVGIAVSMTESTLINVNHGDTAGPDSTGLFQQRDHWGAREDRMNPAYAAQAFFLGVGNVPGLKSLPGWESMPVHQAAQAVQRSAYSDGSNYLEWVPLATKIVDAYYDSTPPTPAVKAGAVGQPTGTVNTDTSKNCTTATIGGPSSTQAGDTYPAKNESYGRSPAEYAVQCGDSVAGGCRGECVDWAAWKIVEKTGTYGTHRVTPLGDGGSWGASAKSKGIPVDMTPVAGDAVFWLPGTGGSEGAGHIGTVQKVNGDGTIVIEEYNFGGDTPATGGGRYHTRTISASNASGYIHFFDPSKSDEENKANLISKGILVAAKGSWPRAS